MKNSKGRPSSSKTISSSEQGISLIYLFCSAKTKLSCLERTGKEILFSYSMRMYSSIFNSKLPHSLDIENISIYFFLPHGYFSGCSVMDYLIHSWLWLAIEVTRLLMNRQNTLHFLYFYFHPMFNSDYLWSIFRKCSYWWLENVITKIICDYICTNTWLCLCIYEDMHMYTVHTHIHMSLCILHTNSKV